MNEIEDIKQSLAGQGMAVQLVLALLLQSSPEAMEKLRALDIQALDQWLLKEHARTTAFRAAVCSTLAGVLARAELRG